MKSIEITDSKQTRTSNFGNSTISMSPEVKNQITNKYRTFTRWNVRDVFRKKKNEEKEVKKMEDSTIDMVKALMVFTEQIRKKDEKNKKKVQKELKMEFKMEESEEMEENRKERMKKYQNPFLIIQFYKKKKGYEFNFAQDKLSKKVIELKAWVNQLSHFNLEKTLDEIYKIMNMAVDFNEQRFLILIIQMAAEICKEIKDYNRSFYFYRQCKIASTYANFPQLKIQALIGMGQVAFELNMNSESIKFFKKALAYAWKIKDRQTEVLLYDYLGKNYYNDGRMRTAHYYHTRYIQNQTESIQSSVRKIADQILLDYEKNYILRNKDDKNLNALFIEYLNLPITNFGFCPETKIQDNNYNNYVDGHSPRKDRNHKEFSFNNFEDVEKQIKKILASDPEFKNEIPNPDIHHNFVSVNRYAKNKRTIQFERSVEFATIVKKKPPSPDFQAMNRSSIEKQIEKVLKEKKNPHWYEDMVANVKKERSLKMGKLKDRTRKNHLSLNKYPEEKKRSSSVQSERIKSTFNKTLLNWIDP